MQTFLIVPPLEDILPPLDIDDGSHIELLQVVPISQRERELKVEKGAEWLLGELNDRGIPTYTHARRYLLPARMRSAEARGGVLRPDPPRLVFLE